ncbi:MAG: prephenate dehydrogenase [Clostridia bacterium]|nr:prephenate dehydrogenase [Clostridia bacterium]
MKICVAGLGIMGGSLCMALKRAGYAVDGWDISSFPPEYALNNGIIDGIANGFEKYDFVFVAMPFKATVDFILDNTFKKGAIVSDICGVKKPIEAAICLKYRNFSYVGCHPMAGKEVSGIENACAGLFDGRSMVITSNADTDAAALDTLRRLTKDMGFGYLIECSAEIHDRKIAYTSQLAHVVSNAYVKDGDLDDCLGFTGGSFQDMTRIAGVDENVWAALYLANAENITEKISSLITSLTEIKDAIEGGEAEKLKKILARGRELFNGNEKNKVNKDIFVQKLR